MCNASFGAFFQELYSSRVSIDLCMFWYYFLFKKKSFDMLLEICCHPLKHQPYELPIFDSLCHWTKSKNAFYFGETATEIFINHLMNENIFKKIEFLILFLFPRSKHQKKILKYVIGFFKNKDGKFHAFVPKVFFLLGLYEKIRPNCYLYYYFRRLNYRRKDLNISFCCKILK